ncbi:MAG: hypothetical protein Q9209_006272 [Squamulea sp. 1 TL-2023]
MVTSTFRTVSFLAGRTQACIRRYSGGASFAGALTQTRTGLCIDFKHMDKILAVLKDDMDVVIQPAVGWQELNAHLETRGLFFPPDPGPGAKVGGMVLVDL